MNHKATTVCLSVITLVVFFGCKKGNNSDTNTPAPIPVTLPYDLAPGTKVIDSATGQSVQSIDSTKIVFSGNTPQLQGFTKNDILISGSTPNAKYGFLRRITDIVKNGTTYIITTTEATLTEAFRELHVDYTKTYTASDTAGRLSGTSFKVDMPALILYDRDQNDSTTYDQVKINGSFEVSPKLHIKIDIGNFSLKYARIEAGFNDISILTLSAGNNIASFSKKINLFTKPLAPFVIPETPLVIVPNLRVSLGADASFSANVTASVKTTTTVSSYLEYQGGSWDKGYDQQMDNEYLFPGIHGTANAKIYLEPAIDFKLYDINWAKGSLFAQAYLKASGQVTPVADCELRAGGSAGAEANLKFFDWNYTAVSYPSIFDYSKLLYSCSTAGIQLPTVTTSSITNITSISASTGGDVISDGGAAVIERGVCWSTSPNPTVSDNKTKDDTGSGTFSSTISGLDSNTTYYIRAYATNSLGTTYGNEETFATLNEPSNIWTLYNQSNSCLPGNLGDRIDIIAIDESGYKWLGGCGSNGLTKLNDVSCTNYNTSNSGIANGCVSAICIDASNNKWIGSNSVNGITEFNGSNWTIYNSTNSSLPAGDITSITIDTFGNKWFSTGLYSGNSTVSGSIVKFDGTNWTIFNASNSGIPANYDVMVIAIDKSNNKWVGTNGGGLVKFDGLNWAIYNTSNSGIPNSNITSIKLDQIGNKWIGTYGGGLAKFDGTTWTVYNTLNSGIPTNYVKTIAVDTQGNKWIGTYGEGLVKFNGTSWTVYNTSNSPLPRNNILYVAIDKNGDKWIGTELGLVKLSNY